MIFSEYSNLLANSKMMSHMHILVLVLLRSGCWFINPLIQAGVNWAYVNEGHRLLLLRTIYVKGHAKGGELSEIIHT